MHRLVGLTHGGERRQLRPAPRWQVCRVGRIRESFASLEAGQAVSKTMSSSSRKMQSEGSVHLHCPGEAARLGQ